MEKDNETLMQTGENKMGVDSIPKLIIGMSLPAIISMFVQALYNIVDSIFVAMNSQNGLAAISLAFPMQMLMVAIAVGTGVGVNSLIARLLGAKNQKLADSAASHGILLCVISSIITALVGFIFAGPFISLFTTDASVAKMGTEYLTIVFVISIGSYISIIAPRILQATGDMMHPMISQLIGAIVNIILDPIFIFGLNMGVAGAAIATVLGQIVSAIYVIYVLIKKDHKVNVSFKSFKFDFEIIKLIYKVGFPSIVMQAVNSFLTSGLNMILTGFSLTAISVLGVYYKLQSFVFMPIFGLGQGSMPVMGYNCGAKNYKRTIGALKVSLIIAFIIMFTGTVIFQCFPELLLKLFSANQEMLDLGVPALRIVSLHFILAAFGIMIGTFFQAIGDGFKSLVISLLRQLVVLLPAAYILAKVFGITGFWFCFLVAELVSVSISLIWLVSTMKKLKVKLNS